MKTPIRIFCALLLAAAMLCVCLDWLGVPDGLPDGASFGTAVDPLLEDGSLTGAELFSMLPSLAGGDPEAYGGVLGLVFYLISTAATAITLLVGFIELILHLCGRRSRGWALPLLVSLSAPFFVLLLLYAQGEYGENVLTLRPAPVAAFAATLLSALLWTLCWRAPRRAAEPEAYDDDYADGDYERGYADEPDDAPEEYGDYDDYDDYDEPDGYNDPPERGKRHERYRPPALGPQVYTPRMTAQEPETFEETQPSDEPYRTDGARPFDGYRRADGSRQVDGRADAPRPTPRPRPYDQDAERDPAWHPASFDETRMIPRARPEDPNAPHGVTDATRVLRVAPELPHSAPHGSDAAPGDPEHSDATRVLLDDSDATRVLPDCGKK